MLRKCMDNWQVYTACMSAIIYKSSELRQFEHDSALKIRNK